ncbi:unnamed protein product [Brassicogethes aeneus]|uniref:Uncharacterized protein n=1 Tax=Brassicogethes aeneus TaxID=1431903 RepID=A0A9P0FM21_BRAAE|nr:unnamed protein product [Brassicogethes aeneus]
MITISLSLLCTVVFRRFLDSYSGRIPKVIPTSNCNVTSTMVILSGALYYLYSHLRKGTLVRIGTKNHLNLHKISSSQCGIQKRKSQKNVGWFFRNAHSCKSRCTEALYRVAKQSYDSLLKATKSKDDNVSNSTCCIKEATSQPSCNAIYDHQDYRVKEQVDRSVQNIISADQMKADGKKIKRISFKLDEDEIKRIPSLPKLKRNKKVRQKSVKITRKTRSGRIYSIYL